MSTKLTKEEFKKLNLCDTCRYRTCFCNVCGDEVLTCVQLSTEIFFGEEWMIRKIKRCKMYEKQYDKGRV